MMTRINRMVAFDYASSSNNDSMNEKKQIPSIATRLTAEVFFKPKRKEISLQVSSNMLKNCPINYQLLSLSLNVFVTFKS